MKRRFLTCLMFSAIIGAGITMISSCADYDEDIRNLQIQIDDHTKLIDALEIKVNSIENTIKELQQRLDNYKPCGCEGVSVDVMKVLNEYIANSGKFKDFDDLMNAIKKAGAGTGDGNCDGNCGLTEDDVKAIIDNYVKINDLQESIKILQEALKNYYTKQEIDEKLLVINNAISEVNGRVDDIDLKIIEINEDLDKIKTTADEALQLAKDNLEMIKLLKQALEDLDIPVGDTSSLSKRIEDLEKALKESYYTKTQVDEFIAQVLKDAKKYTDDEISKLRIDIEEKIDDLQEDLDKLKTRVTTLETTVAQQTKDIKSLFYNQNHLITSIELQGSKNPAFGRYALPDGTSSNVLIAYYGQTEAPVMFPAIDDAGVVAACSSMNNWITEEDYQATGFTPLVFNGTLMNEEGNAGKLYLTVNPSNVDFTGANFKLVNSLGEEAPVVLGNLKPCTEKIAFGYGRATVTSASANGFYEATATLDESKIDEAKLVIDDQLKNAIKSVYKNKLNANFSDLAVAIYNQFNGFIDAYGVQGEFKYKENNTDGNPVEKTGKVTSRYDIAATALKPLSYAADFGKLGKLPTITPLSELDINLKKFIDPKKFNFTIPASEIGFEIKVDFSDIYVDGDGNIWSDITVTEANKKYEQVPVIIISKDEIADADWNKKQAELLAKILDDRASAWGSQLTQEFNKQFGEKMAEMQDKIYDAIDSIGGKLENAIDDMLTNLNNALNSKLKSADRFINQLNQLSNTINSKLDNLNSLLQASIVYEAADGTFHSMSTAKGMPTSLTGSGAINLYATSMTGEIAVPAFKKYVAVTNIYKDGKNAHEDATLKAALQSANNPQYQMNTIIDGDHNAVIFHPTISGATYEIVYSALDFNGKISQRKYYVKVN